MSDNEGKVPSDVLRLTREEKEGHLKPWSDRNRKRGGGEGKKRWGRHGIKGPRQRKREQSRRDERTDARK